MPVQIALLRAVNVGGTGALKMTELKALCEDLGFRDVKTHIQSGNVLFRSDLSKGAAGQALDAGLARILGKAPGVMIRDRMELEAIIAGNPFPEAKPNYLMISFLSAPAPRDALDRLVAPDGERAHVAGCEIYVHYPNGSGRSRLVLPAIRHATARNLNTVVKLVELAREREETEPALSTRSLPSYLIDRL
ncbi:DUF1697 domain-containing protein [Pararhizobium antarcticum]|uniref:DUF1697 domain-containing protein n=1 Tax=Pararhizobium antarcticum TaxID=1798805 RepID=A0A657LSS3_9HYPH|nr:DUF1697 domain-containing protein [Pararhizobium antarcticum]OJF95850.1 hypothetical protein AX760_18620 [Pararhizobium antarcticum]OJF99293.1 hypothetical protein AX761_11255 [Rhizobium sp. 58]